MQTERFLGGILGIAACLLLVVSLSQAREMTEASARATFGAQVQEPPDDEPVCPGNCAQMNPCSGATKVECREAVGQFVKEFFTTYSANHSFNTNPNGYPCGQIQGCPANSGTGTLCDQVDDIDFCP